MSDETRLIECATCGLPYNPADLSDVFAHEHQIIHIIPEEDHYESKKIG